MKSLKELFKDYDKNNKKTVRESFKDMENVGRSVKEIFEDMSEKKK